MINTKSHTFAKEGDVPNRGFLNGIPMNHIRHMSGDRIMATIPFENDYAELVTYRNAVLPSWANSNGGEDAKCNIILYLTAEYVVIPHSTVTSTILDGKTIIEKDNEKVNGATT